ncbi:potassium channel family protein [Bacteroidota bacterium]
MIGLNKRNKYREFKPSTKKPVLPGIVLLIVLIIGTVGYYILWIDTDSTWIDALYMTLITIATIGYGEVHQLDDVGKIFTIFISITGIGSLFYVMSVIMENLFIVQLHNYRGKKKNMKEIEKLRDHIILIGYGRVGQLAASMLLKRGERFVVIDDDFVEEDFVHLKQNLMRVTGNATEDNTLLKAGVERARGIIVATGNSATTVFVVLSAKVLNPDVFIVARADEDSDTEKLLRAGADRIVNPYSIGGQRLANLMINRNIVDFLETSFGIGDGSLRIENLHLPTDCIWFNKTLKELDLRQKYGVAVLAVVRDGKPVTNPGGNFKVIENDQFIMMGTEDELKQIEMTFLENKEYL